MDTTQDTNGSLNDGRWLTYREIAQARGIDVPSAVKLSRRQHWRRQAGNRNTVRIFVPLDWLSGESLTAQQGCLVVGWRRAVNHACNSGSGTTPAGGAASEDAEMITSSKPAQRSVAQAPARATNWQP